MGFGLVINMRLIWVVWAAAALLTLHILALLYFRYRRKKATADPDKKAQELSELQLKVAAMESELRSSYEEIARHAYASLADASPKMSWMQQIAGKDWDETSGLILIEMERLKYINNTYGHSFGNQVLVSVTERLNRIAVEEAFFLMWLESDEFAVLTMKKTDIEQTKQVITRIYDTFKTPVLIQNNLMRISTSCGIALTDGDDTTIETLFRRAYHALNKAKKLGRGKHLFYDNAMTAEANELRLMEEELQKALEKGEFGAYFQPQFDISTGEISGFEALARWNDPVKGLRYPCDFIQAAEETGQILLIGETVLREACAFETRIVREFGKMVPLSVNISAYQLEQTDFVEFIGNVAAEHGLPPEYLSIEITETMMMNNIIDAMDKIIKLKELGIQIHLDDFGTGYSSLNYIKNLPVDVVKIDRNFIRDLGKPQADYLIEFIITLAHKLGKKIIAEGVEVQEQWDQLTAFNCDMVQGYLKGRPVPDEVALSMLRTEFQRNGFITGKPAAQ